MFFNTNASKNPKQMPYCNWIYICISTFGDYCCLLNLFWNYLQCRRSVILQKGKNSFYLLLFSLTFAKETLFLMYSIFFQPIVFHRNYDYWILHLYYFHDRCIHIILSLQNQVPYFLCCSPHCIHRIYTYYYAYHRCCREKARGQITDL